jgi:hypothetical protein
MDAGVSVGSSRLAYGQPESVRLAAVQYETTIIDAIEQPGRLVTGPVLSQGAQVAMSARSAKVYSPLRQSGLVKFADPQRRRVVQFDDEDYAIASTIDAGVRSEFGTGLSKTMAYQLLKAHLAAHPEDRGYLQVVPLAEIGSAP